MGCHSWLCSRLMLCILGVDHLGVVRHVGSVCLMVGHDSVPFELVKDGDLLFLNCSGCFVLGDLDTDADHSG